MNQEALDLEREQLLSFGERMFFTGANPFDPDGPNATALRRLLRGAPTQMDIRRFHLKLGWSAGHGVNCAGTVYRTEAFMQISLADRVGKNPDGRVNYGAPHQNIHIEHTIPVGQFFKEVWTKRPQDEVAALRYLTMFSPTTGTSYVEKKALQDIEKGVHRNSNCSPRRVCGSVL